MKEAISIVSNVWIRQLEFEHAGDIKEEHTHPFDHQTLIAKGKFDVTVDGQTTTFSAPQIVYVKKGLVHTFKCVSSDGLAYCIHPIRDGDEVTDIISDDQMPLLGTGLDQGV